MSSRYVELPSHVFVGAGANPPGLNHENFLTELALQPSIKKIFFVPTFNPVHKNAEWMAPFEHRLNMSVHLVAGMRTDLRKKVIVSDIEREIGGRSHPINAVRRLEKDLGKTVGVGIGCDNARKEVFESWEEHEELLRRGVRVIRSGNSTLRQSELMEGMHIVGQIATSARSGMAREAVAKGEWSELRALVGVGVMGYLKEVGDLWR